VPTIRRANDIAVSSGKPALAGLARGRRIGSAVATPAADTVPPRTAAGADGRAGRARPVPLASPPARACGPISAPTWPSARNPALLTVTARSNPISSRRTVLRPAEISSLSASRTPIVYASIMSASPASG
jgi:hypothetical protein